MRTSTFAVVVCALAAACRPHSPIEGRVVDLDGRPVAGAGVRAGGAYASSDAEGRFSIADAPGVYDLVITALFETVVYQGLTRRDPTVTVPMSRLLMSDSAAGPFTASISGAISGGPALDGGLTSGATNVLFVSPEARAYGGAGGGETAYVIDPVRWAGGLTSRGVLRALQGGFSLQWPALTFAYAEHTGVTVSDGDALQGMDLHLSPVESGSIQATFATASGNYSQAYVQALWPDGATMNVNIVNVASGPLAIPVPRIAGVTFIVEAVDAGTGWAAVGGLGPDAEAVAVTVPPAPVLLAPGPDAALAADTVFRWEVAPGGVAQVTFIPSCGTRVVVFTAAGSVNVDALEAAGVALPSPDRIRWSVDRLAPFGDIDALAGTTVPGWTASLHPFTGSLAHTYSGERTIFTGSGDPPCPPIWVVP